MVAAFPLYQGLIIDNLPELCPTFQLLEYASKPYVLIFQPLKSNISTVNTVRTYFVRGNDLTEKETDSLLVHLDQQNELEYKLLHEILPKNFLTASDVDNATWTPGDVKLYLGPVSNGKSQIKLSLPDVFHIKNLSIAHNQSAQFQHMLQQSVIDSIESSNTILSINHDETPPGMSTRQKLPIRRSVQIIGNSF